MMKCVCHSDNCKGEVKRYSVHSPTINTTYPNRFWGVTDYCDTHAQEEKEDFILEPVSNTTKLITL